MRRLALLLSVLPLLLNACSDAQIEPAGERKSQKETRQDARGKLTGEDGFLLSGGKPKDTSGTAAAIGVNIFLWRATLDTLSFMPIASADPFGGVIITDWYEDPKTPGERFKVNAVILDKTLRADGVKVTVFKQKLTGSTWRDQKVKDSLDRQMEDAILTRARQLRVSQLGNK